MRLLRKETQSNSIKKIFLSDYKIDFIFQLARKLELNLNSIHGG